MQSRDVAAGWRLPDPAFRISVRNQGGRQAVHLRRRAFSLRGMQNFAYTLLMSTIRLTPHSEELLQKQFTRGPYRSPEEVIERALETLAQKESTLVHPGSAFTLRNAG